MKKIKLSRGQTTKVSDKDFSKLMVGNKWYALLVPRTGKFYAVRTFLEKGVKKMQYMHRLVMGIEDPNILVDHKDRDSLNNQDDNLRVATNSVNLQNQTKRKATSKYIGVSWSTDRKKWAAHIKKGKNIGLGRYTSEIEAAKAYDSAATQLYGEDARLNFPRKKAACQGT